MWSPGDMIYTHEYALERALHSNNQRWDRSVHPLRQSWKAFGLIINVKEKGWGVLGAKWDAHILINNKIYHLQNVQNTEKLFTMYWKYDE